MANLDFKTKEGQAKATELAKEIFRDFDNVEKEFSEYGTVNITVDEVFEFCFTSDALLQAKRLITLLELQKLNRLTNGIKTVPTTQTAQTVLQDLYDQCFEEENQHTLTFNSNDILNIAKHYGVVIEK